MSLIVRSIYLLERAKENDSGRFHALVAGLYGPGRSPVSGSGDERPCRNIFSDGAFDVVSDWKPEIWAITDDSDLASLEALLTKPWEVDMEAHQATTPSGQVFTDWTASVHHSDKCLTKANLCLIF
jgi:hypothetical protein